MALINVWPFRCLRTYNLIPANDKDISAVLFHFVTMNALSLNNFSPLDPQSFSEELKIVVDFIADYCRNMEKYPVQSQVDSRYQVHHCSDSAPYHPEPLESILKDVSDSVIPGLAHWQSPNFFGYFPASVSTAGFLGEMLGTAFNVVGFNWLASPAATELESIVMDWVGKMLASASTLISFLRRWWRCLAWTYI